MRSYVCCARHAEGPLESWLAYNEMASAISHEAQANIAPLPPLALMQDTSGLSGTEEFSQHGAHIMRALAAASPAPLNGYRA